MIPFPPPRPMQQSTGAKRQRDELEGLGIGELPDAQMQSGEMHSMSSQMSGQAMVGYGGQPLHQAYHGHTLPNQGPRGSKMPRLGEPDDSSSLSQSGQAPSVVGMEGMPPPAPRPRGPKLKFTPEDDQLLVDLKENKSLTWKQIAEFFPGRSSGTLQVRYCTKLKAKTTQWTDETVRICTLTIYCWLIFARSKNSARPSMIMNKRNGVLLPRKLELASRLLRVKKKPESYSIQSLQQKHPLLILETQNISSKHHTDTPRVFNALHRQLSSGPLFTKFHILAITDTCGGILSPIS
jgi:hypothetical protein